MTLSRPLPSGLHRPSQPAQTAPVSPSCVDVLGVPLSVTDYDDTMDWIDASVAHDEKGYVCVAAAHTIMVCGEDPGRREAVLGASMTVPDGQPLVWAMNALGGNLLEERVYGPELMARYCERAAQTGTRMYLYGGRNHGALVQLALDLPHRSPAAVPAPLRGGRGRERRRDERVARGRHLGRRRRPQAGEGDGRDARPARRPGARRRRRRVRLPRRPGRPNPPLDAVRRPFVVVSPRAPAAAPVAALRPIQPALRRRLHAAVRPPPHAFPAARAV